MTATTPSRRLLGPAIATLLAFILLCGLGVWQLQRLAWKEGLLAQIHERIAAPPVPLPDEAQWPGLTPNEYAYRHVTLTGTFDYAQEALVFRPFHDETGYLVLTPLTLASGAQIIVNRGFVREDLRDPAKRSAGQIPGEVTLSGLMREPESRNPFTPADDPAKGLWYTRDSIAIAQHFGLQRAAPFSIDADATPVPGGWPKGGTTVIDIPNNHLSYAFTWFGLAAALLGVFAVFAWRRPKA
ncbi:SURF1 family protein [Methylovirgula sp. 4M-Z18]|uniref:SURF1 family protein n=1 Tax=Methylovirgula sp. 4M-Z18 TaxID=2293567 RepID=UPI000E2FD0F3|nr:SURF1 family protein [Methylovirgula sp. 4M-Z18]RFB78857.1 SURF1 family protein [Methylovirgula sp. 4M-Z18]